MATITLLASFAQWASLSYTWAPNHILISVESTDEW